MYKASFNCAYFPQSTTSRERESISMYSCLNCTTLIYSAHAMSFPMFFLDCIKQVTCNNTSLSNNIFLLLLRGLVFRREWIWSRGQNAQLSFEGIRMLIVSLPFLCVGDYFHLHSVCFYSSVEIRTWLQTLLGK